VGRSGNQFGKNSKCLRVAFIAIRVAQLSQQVIKFILADVAEWWVTEVVSQRGGLGDIGVDGASFLD
jgi:hypothetical protein